MKFEEYKKINEFAFDNLSIKYKERRQNLQIKLEKLFLINEFVEYLLINFGSPTILEIGPGSGVALEKFQNSGIDTTALDISSKMIEISKKYSPKAKFIHSDFLNHNFEVNSFSGIFAKSVFHLFPKNKIKDVFNQSYLILKENGILYISFPIFSEAKENYILRTTSTNLFQEYRSYYTEKELNDNISKSPFKLYKKLVNLMKDSNDESFLNLEAILIKC